MTKPRRRTSLTVHGRLHPIKRVAQRTLDRSHPKAAPGEVLADYDSALGVIRLARGQTIGAEEGLVEHEATHAAIYELALAPKLHAADPSGQLEEDICNLVVPAVRAAMTREGT